MLAAQHEAGQPGRQAALTGPPTAALTAYRTMYLPWGGEGGDYSDAPPAAHGSRAAAGGEDGAYLCGSLEGWGELKQWPRAQPSGSRSRLKREHGAYRCRVPAIARRTNIAAALGVRRSNARGVRAMHVSQSRSCQHWQSVC